MTQTAPEFTLARWATAQEAPFAAPVFMFDADDLPPDLSGISVVLRTGGAERARELAKRNPARVLLSDAALNNASIVAPLAKELGAGRLGLWLPVRRMGVSWALDCESNADFRCVTPSRASPAWEVLTSDGRPTGTDAHWWTGQFLAHRDQTGITEASAAGGVSMVLIAADLGGDADLNICAGLTEAFGAGVWLTPLNHPDADLRPWVQFGHVRNLVVPGAEHYSDAAMAALTQTLSPQPETAAA
jgi:hypothetical protein